MIIMEVTGIKLVNCVLFMLQANWRELFTPLAPPKEKLQKMGIQYLWKSSPMQFKDWKYIVM